MKKEIPVFLALLLLSCAGPGEPDQVLISFFHDLQGGRGNSAVSHLTPEAVESIAMGMGFHGIRSNPDSSSSALAAYGITLSPSEIETLTPETLAARLFESPLLTALLADASLEIESTSVRGDRALINASVLFLGDTAPVTVEMLLYSGRWAIECEGSGFAL